MRAHTSRNLNSTIMLLVALLAAWALAGSAAAQPFNCLPTCAEDDGRFLVIAAGDEFRTMSDPTLDLTFVIPAGTTSFEFGLFDGDVLDSDTGGAFHWDTGTFPTEAVFEYTLFADPLGDVSGTMAVLGPMSTLDETSPGVPLFPDNAWTSFTITTGPEAQSPTGEFTYRLRAELTNPDDVIALNAFKVRTSDIAVIEPIAQPFGYIANWTNVDDGIIIYPTFDPNVTTYDGTFTFFVSAEVPQTTISVWDGDFDRGSFDGTDQDTDDPNTPGAPFEPTWATIDTVPEGVAVGLAGSTGDPNDDFDPAAIGGLGVFFTRTPSIEYTLTTPDNQTFFNPNPSGNREWELFRISTVAGDPTADFITTTLPAGSYELAIDGVDMANLNFLLTPFRVLCADEAGESCEPPPPAPFRVGDTVYEDLDADGTDDGGTDPGIPGVCVELIGSAGGVIDRQVTGANGNYSFPVFPDDYTVQVASKNFTGLAPAGALGDRVWLDVNGDGVQDDPADEPGLPNVAVHLYLDDGDFMADPASDTFVALRRTDANGEYSFNDLPPGTYFTDVIEFTVPAGLALSGGTDPSALRTITSTEVFDDLDYGYTNGNGIIGDFVWSDADGDGLQDAGEPGIGGVTLDLIDDNGDVIATATTAADGSYLFTGLVAGDYVVEVTDTAGVLAGYGLTASLDGPPAVTATLTLAVGGARLDADFGYQNAALFDIADVVWLDTNGDGLLNGAEAGIQDVTVNLVGPGGEVVASTVTDANGDFSFPDLPDGSYTLVITDVTGELDGLTTTTAPAAAGSLAVVLAGADVTGINFGYNLGGTAAGAVGDRVWLDANGDGVQDPGEPGLANVTVSLYLDDGDAMADVDVDTLVASLATGLDGLYLFDDLAPGTYFTAVDDTTVPAGLVLSGGTDPGALVTIATSERFDTLDFGYTGLSALVGDYVWFDADADGVQDAGEAGAGDVTLELLDGGGAVVAETRTDASGLYLFAGVVPGSYTVAVTDTAGILDGYALTYSLDGLPNETAALSVSAGGAFLGADFGYRDPALFSISDVVWFDTNRNGIQDEIGTGLDGVTVNLLGARNRVLATTTTAGGGLFSFPDLPDGSYSLAITDHDGVLSGLVPTTTGSARGFHRVLLVGADVAGINFGWVDTGALESFFGTTDDGDGDPDRHTDTVVDQDILDYDFGYSRFGSIGDRVWLDEDQDGDQDGTESGINGVTVELLDSGGTVIDSRVTAGDGNYLFDRLPPGNYTVRVVTSTLAPELSQTFDFDGVLDDETDVTLGVGEMRDNVDFGYAECGTCLGKVTRLTLQYIGTTANAQIQVFAKKGGLTEEVFNDVVQPGGNFEVVGLPTGTSSFAGTLGTEIRIFVDGMLQTVIHTSCSVEIGPGLISGDFEVLAGFSKHGGALCPIDGGGGSVCLPAIDFETDAAGAALYAGQVIDNEWVALGVTVTTHDSVNHPAMIFDSSNPTGGDYDLGTPNQTFSGPGIGSGGEAGQPGENGVALGKVLIISEDADSSDPDDNAAPGTIFFTFASEVRVDEVGILDIDEGMAGTVTAFDGGGSVIGAVGMAGNLGNNSVQTVALGASGVRRLEIYFPGSGAVSGIVFCVEDSTCLPDLDFEGLDAGTLVSDQFAGIQVTTDDPANNPAMIFDSSNPTGGDTDLGSPNADFGGPGVGAGGGAGEEGENGVALGNVLIISEDGISANPDDNAAGGTLIFTFAEEVFTSSVAILDIDGPEAMGMVKAYDSAVGGVVVASAMMRPLGDNSFQTVPLVASRVRRLEVHFPSSGAVAGITFCDDDCTPIRVRDDFDVASFGNNDGPDDWSDNWIEDDPKSGGAGPTLGQVQVSKGFLRLNDYPDTGGEPSLARQVDLSGAASATLRFDFDTSSGVDKDDAVTVEISPDGGASWTILEVITNIYGATWQERSFDVTPFISAQTRVRFRVSNKYGGSGETFYVGYVEIETSCGGEALTVRDEFNQQSFGNNDGPDNWQGNWHEDDPVKYGEGPAAGHVKVYNGALKLFDNPDTGGEPSAAREVDLSGRSVATFTFDWSTTSGVDSDDAIAIEVSSNGGASWTLLQTLTGIYGASSGSESHDISGFISADTRVRFRVSNKYGGSGEYFYADDVQIQAQ